MGSLKTPQVRLFFRSPPAIYKVRLSCIAVVAVVDRDKRIERYPLLPALEYIKILLFRNSSILFLHFATCRMVTRVVQAGRYNMLAASHRIVVEHQAQRVIP